MSEFKVGDRVLNVSDWVTDHRGEKAHSGYFANVAWAPPTLSLSTHSIDAPRQKDNDMRITTVRTKAGYVGQVINSITEQIVYETKPYKHQDKAIRAAQKASDAALERAFK